MKQQNQLKLATSIEEIREKGRDGFKPIKSKKQAQSFIPETTDIFISPFHKSGTTWLQQIVHSLRTRGDMDFDEITEVVPWLEMGYDLGLNIYAAQKSQPRAFKSHLSWEKIPKGARYIYIVRDPKDVAISNYNFKNGWVFDGNAIPLETHLKKLFLNSTAYWDHINSWWSQKNNHNVLFLCYETMKKDLSTAIQVIANFMNISLDDELFEIVKQHASFDFMKAHNHQFDDHIVRNLVNRSLKVPTNATSTKVKTGRSGLYKEKLSPRLVYSIDSLWKKYIKPEFKLDNYNHLKNTIEAMNQKRLKYPI